MTSWAKIASKSVAPAITTRTSHPSTATSRTATATSTTATPAITDPPKMLPNLAHKQKILFDELAEQKRKRNEILYGVSPDDYFENHMWIQYDKIVEQIEIIVEKILKITTKEDFDVLESILAPNDIK